MSIQDNNLITFDLSDLQSESGRQSETIDLGESPGPVLHRLKTMQMAIPPRSKDIIISFDDDGNISNIVFVQDTTPISKTGVE